MFTTTRKQTNAIRLAARELVAAATSFDLAARENDPQSVEIAFLQIDAINDTIEELGRLAQALETRRGDDLRADRETVEREESEAPRREAEARWLAAEAADLLDLY